MIIRSRAPLRISFGGGGTDISPYPEEHGGVALNTSIDKYAYATLVPREDDTINVRSLDYNIVVRFNAGEEPKYDGNLDLVKATVKVLGVQQGFDLFLHSDVPPGSGLGSSSTIVVGLVGLFKHWLKLLLTDYQVAELAYQIEREEVGIKGGKQDQFAATFGGFNFIEFKQETTIVNPLRIKDNVLNELQYRLMLCHTGKTRLSAGIIADQTQRYAERKEEVIRALEVTKALAIQMKDALLLGRLHELGVLLHEAWCAKQQFSPKITDSYIDSLYEEARKSGAAGGKLLGAGGGGFLLLFCQFDKRHIIAQNLENMGGQIVEFAFDSHGLQTWEVEEK